MRDAHAELRDRYRAALELGLARHQMQVVIGDLQLEHRYEEAEHLRLLVGRQIVEVKANYPPTKSRRISIIPTATYQLYNNSVVFPNRNPEPTRPGRTRAHQGNWVLMLASGADYYYRQLFYRTFGNDTQLRTLVRNP